MANNTIKFTESQLQRAIKESINKIMKESVDSVSPDPFVDNGTYSPSDDEIKKSEEFYAKHCPWRKWPDAQTLEGLITCAYNLRHEFDSGKYSYNHLICDLYNMC